jgi:hypothetical protein
MAKTMQQHMIDVHKTLSAYHAGQAGRHDKCASAHTDLGKAAAGNNAHTLLAKEHAAMAAADRVLSDFHKDGMEACAKGIEPVDLSKGIVPTGISGVAPEAPNHMVHRAGQPTTPQKPDVPEQFQNLFKVDGQAVDGQS